MARTVLQKIGARPGARCVAVGTSPRQVAALGVRPGPMMRWLDGEYDCIHAFVTTAAELTSLFVRLKPHVRRGGMLWISWPKAGSQGTDLTLGTVIAHGYRHGMVESKTISVNATWSAIKFTFPIPGKRYRNSHGRLEHHAA